MEGRMNGEFICFLATVVEFLLQEYETGVYVRDRFSTPKIRSLYAQHWATWCGLRFRNGENIIADFQRYVKTRRAGRRRGKSENRSFGLEPLVDSWDVESDFSTPNLETGISA